MSVHPIAFDTLVALHAGELGPETTAALDEHLFTCDECAAADARLGRLIGGLRTLIPPVLSKAQRDRLVAGGTRIVFTPCEAGTPATAFFAPDADLLVHGLRGDLSRADRVDIEVRTPETVTYAFFDVPFDREAGEVLIACQRHYEMLIEGQPLFRVVAHEAGVARTVGDYLVIHIWR